MMNKLKKGFTLVELIVVIAIIAILAVVSVVGYNAFIERANLSSDNQTLASMNNVLNTHTAVNFEELDADDVKYIINTANGEEFNFTPKTKGYGFFYVEAEKQIVLMKYDDFENYVSPINEGDTPEEIFGKGKYVLSESGHAIANLVYGIKNLGKADNLSEEFNRLLATYPDKSDYIYNMGPAHSVYVSNEGWKFSSSIQYKRIIFATDTVHIPSALNLPQTVMPKVTAKFPRTVKSIDEHSFSQFGTKLDMQISNKDMYIAEDAFTTSQLSTYGLTVKSIPSLALKYYNGTEYVLLEDLLTLEEGQDLIVDIVGLPREEIYKMYLKSYFQGDKTYYLIAAYGKDQLIGQVKVEINRTNINN